MNQEKFGKFIKEIRHELGYTQQELADKIGVSDRAISKWENGRGMPDISLLIPLSDALNVSVLELLNGERAKDYNDAAIKLIRHNNKMIMFWKWWFLGVTNIILVFMLLCVIYGYFVPAYMQNIAVVLSNSMSPRIKYNDVIVYDVVPIENITKSDLIVFNFVDDNDKIYDVEVVHMVDDIIRYNGEIKLITKGINNIDVDSQYVTKDNYLGVYNHKISKLGSFFIRNNFKHLPLVLIFLLLGIFSIIYLDILQIIKKH